MALSNTELANRISNLIDRWQTFLDQWFNWQGGDPNGGPNNDGQYPLSDATGTTKLYSSIPKLQETLSTLETEGNSAVSQAEDAELTASEYATLTGATVTDYDSANGDTDTGEYSAKKHANDAASSASTAQTAESGALTAETDAQSARDAAQTAETNAGNHESGALTARDQAETAESGAQTAESNAQAHEVDAGEHELTAQRFANESEDVEVVDADTGSSTGLYSAKHYMKKASATASGVLYYKSHWDASTGSYPTPDQKGNFYPVSTGGTVDGVQYNAGDMIVYNGGDETLSDGWDHIDATDRVVSVAGKTGTVDIAFSDLLNSIADAQVPQSAVTQYAAALDWTNLNIDQTDVSKSDVGLGNVTNVNPVAMAVALG